MRSEGPRLIFTTEPIDGFYVNGRGQVTIVSSKTLVAVSDPSRVVDAVLYDLGRDLHASDGIA